MAEREVKHRILATYHDGEMQALVEVGLQMLEASNLAPSQVYLVATDDRRISLKVETQEDPHIGRTLTINEYPHGEALQEFLWKALIDALIIDLKVAERIGRDDFIRARSNGHT